MKLILPDLSFVDYGGKCILDANIVFSGRLKMCNFPWFLTKLFCHFRSYLNQFHITIRPQSHVSKYSLFVPAGRFCYLIAQTGICLTHVEYLEAKTPIAMSLNLQKTFCLLRHKLKHNSLRLCKMRQIVRCISRGR